MTRLFIAGTALLLASASVAGQTVLATVYGGAANEFFGTSCCSLGDIDGDSVPDLAVGAPGASGNAGAVRVLSGLDFHLLYSVNGSTPNAKLGSQVARLGDVDGDQIADFVASAPFVGTGSVLTISGATGTVLRTRFGPTSSAKYGERLAAGGDFDGDGVGDYCTYYNWMLFFYVIEIRSGATDAFLSSPNGGANLLSTGLISLSFVPDSGNDGADDLLVGYSGFQNNVGEAFFVAGPTGQTLFTVVATTVRKFGINVGYIGDVDSDGYSDAILADEPSPALQIGGGFSIYSGANGATIASYNSDITMSIGIPGGQARSIAALGDANGDGVADYAVASGVATTGYRGATVFSAFNTEPLLLYYASSPTNMVFVFDAGDLTLDGRSELLCAESDFDGPFVNCGAIKVFTFIAPIAAAVSSLGGSSGALGGGPLLAATLPVIGGLATFTLTGAAPLSAGNLALDFGLPVATPLGAGAVFHLDLAHLASWILLPVAASSTGAFQFSVPVPMIPLLAGLPVTVQAVLLGTAGPLGFDLSNGLATQLGY